MSRRYEACLRSIYYLERFCFPGMPAWWYYVQRDDIDLIGTKRGWG